MFKTANRNSRWNAMIFTKCTHLYTVHHGYAKTHTMAAVMTSYHIPIPNFLIGVAGSYTQKLRTVCNSLVITIWNICSFAAYCHERSRPTHLWLLFVQ
jgi:hypothetical protein